ncbi:MAG: hypothetical protein IKU29_06280 [Parabacteroides sp.]|nr:hypothetical protein [Parabacteroides sp.]
MWNEYLCLGLLVCGLLILVIYSIYTLYEYRVLNPRRLEQQFLNIKLNESLYIDPDITIDDVPIIYKVIDKYRDKFGAKYIKFKNIHGKSERWVSMATLNAWFQQVELITHNIPKPYEEVVVKIGDRLHIANIVKIDNKFMWAIVDFNKTPCIRHLDLPEIKEYYRIIN